MAKRNRQRTEQTIYDAACSLLAEQGFQAFGINAVAQAAAVDKVLIYRYYGNLDGLLARIAEREPLFPAPAALLNADSAPRNRLSHFAHRYQKALDALPLNRSLQHWAPIEKNPLTLAYLEHKDAFWAGFFSLVTLTDEAQAPAFALVPTLCDSSAGAQELSRFLETLSVEISIPDGEDASAPEAGDTLPTNLL